MDSEVLSRPIRDLGLTIAGSRLGPIVEEFLAELDALGLRRVRPRVYLSTEWGVPDGTIAIAIPFYLASSRLVELHADRTGHVEGRGRAAILRYLRHEMGHVINYAYGLFETEEWERLFGPMSMPYGEDYRPKPFSREFVRHLPGWYAQKHPDEDWAETFAVWMTPGRNWKADYGEWPVVMKKLAYCDRVMQEVRSAEPKVTCDDLDEDVSEIAYSIDDFYTALEVLGEPLPRGLDSTLGSLFEDFSDPDETHRLASSLMKRYSGDIATEVYQWTGHFPEQTRSLLRLLAERCDDLGLGYTASREPSALVGLTALITSMAANHVAQGRYLV